MINTVIFSLPLSFSLHLYLLNINLVAYGRVHAHANQLYMDNHFSLKISPRNQFEECIQIFKLIRLRGRLFTRVSDSARYSLHGSAAQSFSATHTHSLHLSLSYSGFLSSIHIVLIVHPARHCPFGDGHHELYRRVWGMIAGCRVPLHIYTHIYIYLLFHLVMIRERTYDITTPYSFDIIYLY